MLLRPRFTFERSAELPVTLILSLSKGEGAWRRTGQLHRPTRGICSCIRVSRLKEGTELPVTLILSLSKGEGA